VLFAIDSTAGWYAHCQSRWLFPRRRRRRYAQVRFVGRKMHRLTKSYWPKHQPPFRHADNICGNLQNHDAINSLETNHSPVRNIPPVEIHIRNQWINNNAEKVTGQNTSLSIQRDVPQYKKVLRHMHNPLAKNKVTLSSQPLYISALILWKQ